MDGRSVARGLSLLSLLPDLGRRTLVMGILNATPDSFSDGGMYARPDRAIDRALRMMDEGADIIDVGGESTRPGAPPVDAREEIRRVMPVIEALAARGVGPLSIDTTKAEVAKAALEAGARLVNDISGMTFDPEMPSVVADAAVPVVLAHARDRPSRMQRGDLEYPGGVVRSVLDALRDRVDLAVEAGVSRDAIAVDPGIGFGKTVAQNLELLRGLGSFRSLGCPVLVGTSRKSFIGAITDRAVDRRIFGTAASVALAIAYGADIVRVHDVPEMLDVVAVAEAIVRAPSGAGEGGASA